MLLSMASRFHYFEKHNISVFKEAVMKKTHTKCKDRWSIMFIPNVYKILIVPCMENMQFMFETLKKISNFVLIMHNDNDKVNYRTKGVLPPYIS